jgi:hypothetical protein
MFVVPEADAAAIRDLQRGGRAVGFDRVAAAVSLDWRQYEAQAAVRTIAGWILLPKQMSTVTRLHRPKDA